MMKRSMVALAVAGAMSFSAHAANVNGFADITLNADNDQYLFFANGEVDTSAEQDGVTVRMDVDFSLATGSGTNASAVTGGPADSAVIEQAFFQAPVGGMLTLTGGVFNNPIGWEAEDAPEMYSVNHGLVYGILDTQTALYGNNVAGVAATVDAGMAKVTLGVLNDIGLNADSSGEIPNSIAFAVNASLMEGLDLELGYVTQEAAAEAVTDVNLTYKGAGATVGLEYLMADKLVDAAMGLMVNYEVMPQVGVTVRYDMVTPEVGDDSTRAILAVSYAMAKNLTVVAEYLSDDDGTNTNDKGTLEFVATF